MKEKSGLIFSPDFKNAFKHLFGVYIRLNVL